MTYREIVYFCLDELKLSSDDSIFTEDHIIFLANKYRNYLLQQQYSSIKKPIPASNYQTICLDLEESSTDDLCDNTYLKSTTQIPNTLCIGNPRVHSIDYYAGEITFISRDRMKYVGHNKWLKNIIYCSISPDNYLYLTSTNPQYLYLDKVEFTAVFEDSSKAAELSCEGSKENICDPLDKDFPLEDALVPALIDLIIKELRPAVYTPSDEENDANDSLDEMNMVHGNPRRV